MEKRKINECYIRGLSVKNVGPFDTLNISFNNGFNFIVGPNSSGKTSILRCLALVASWERLNVFRYRESPNPSIWLYAVYNGEEKQVGYNVDMADGNMYRKAHALAYNCPPVSTENKDTILYAPLPEWNEKINITPLFLGAYRRIDYRKISGMATEQSVAESRQYYSRNSMEFINGGIMPDVKQWMINRYFQLEKDWAAPLKRNWEWIMGHLDVLSPSNCKIEFREIRRDLEPVFVIQGKECYLEEISAGFQSVFSLVFAITEWVEATWGEDACYLPEAVGTVVIDELDAHLHPEWQLTIRDSLTTVFPKLQFITTTHSPHLIATAHSGELIVLPELTGTVQAEPTNKTYSGWNTDQILEEVMQVKSLENKTYSTLIHEATTCMENRDISGLKSAIQGLEKAAHPTDTIVSVMKIGLAKLQLEAEDDTD